MNDLKNIKLLIETISVFALFSILAFWIHNLPIELVWRWVIYIPVLLFQGFWLFRFYVIGHEASHSKLFPSNRKINNIVGSIILLPMMIPFHVYRKIHLFHHSFNRRDHHTSAIDVFVISSEPTIFQKVYYHTLWYFNVFGGGFFVHSLITVLLFLFVPQKLAVRISPAFRNWKIQDQLVSIILFISGIALHIFIYFLFGRDIYLFTLGFPMLLFVFIFSMLFYVFHYDTTIGEEVHYNARSTQSLPVLSWILMNFNEHATHHQNPGLFWYELAEKRILLQGEYAAHNQKTNNFFVAIISQLKGPKIVYEHSDTKSDR